MYICMYMYPPEMMVLVAEDVELSENGGPKNRPKYVMALLYGLGSQILGNSHIFGTAKTMTSV